MNEIKLKFTGSDKRLRNVKGVIWDIFVTYFSSLLFSFILVFTYHISYLSPSFPISSSSIVQSLRVLDLTNASIHHLQVHSSSFPSPFSNLSTVSCI